MNVKLSVIEDYENEPLSGPKKQTQNKPNLVRRRRIPKGQYRLPENPATPIIGVQPQIPCYVRDGPYTDHAQDGIYTDYLVPLVAIHSCKVNWRQE